MSTARAILGNTLSQILGKAISAIISVLIIKIITNYLSLSGYGEYTTIYEFLAFFAIAADLGLFTIGVREMSKSDKNMAEVAGNILGLRLFLSIGTMALAVIVAFLIPKYSDTLIPVGCAIAAITTIFSLLNGTVAIVLQVHLQMHWTSLTFIIGRIATLAYMAYIVFYGIPADGGLAVADGGLAIADGGLAVAATGVAGAATTVVGAVTAAGAATSAIATAATRLGFYHLLIAGIVGNALMFLGTAIFANRLVKLRPRFDFRLWKKVVMESLPYGLALILSTIYFRVDSILLFLLRGSQEVGLFGVPMRMLEMLAVIPLYFMNSVLPMLTKAISEKSEHYKVIIQYSWDFLASIAFPILIGTVVLAYPVVAIVSNPEFLSRLNENFYGSDIGLQILIFALVFQFLNVLFAFILIAVHKQTKLLYINAACVLFNIIGNIILIPEFGIRGAAFISVLSELFILIGTFFAARHYLSFKISLKNTSKIISSAVTMGVAIYVMHDYILKIMEAKGLILLVIIGAVIYGIMLLLTGAISKDMLKMLKRKQPQEIISDTNQSSL